MAIVIPSSKTYDRQNPKVRDNVIERIEIGAVEVVTDNEYETPVYNEKIKNDFGVYEEKQEELIGDYVYEISSSGIGGSFYNFAEAISYVSIKPQYKTLSIKIPKHIKNKFISEVYDKIDKNETPYIKVSAYCEKVYGEISATVDVATNDEHQYPPGENDDWEMSISGFNVLSSSTERPTITDLSNLTKLEQTSTDKISVVQVATAKAELELKSFSNINTLSVKDNEKEDTWDFIDLKILVGLNLTKMGWNSSYIRISLNDLPNTRTLKGTYENYIPTQVEITIYGNTIGIDLVDKTVYINGETAKKVHSIDGNELMQTSNYINNENENITENAIRTMYGETQIDYAKGKETAVLRCSIGDYYDYDSGEKVIAIDNSTGKMSFKMYDQVIPMVYGADGKDRPMSLYQDGTQKVFQVLGTNIYYDGAVWQELLLQEVDKRKIV